MRRSLFLERAAVALLTGVALVADECSASQVVKEALAFQQDVEMVDDVEDHSCVRKELGDEQLQQLMQVDSKTGTAATRSGTKTMNTGKHGHSQQAAMLRGTATTAAGTKKTSQKLHPPDGYEKYLSEANEHYSRLKSGAKRWWSNPHNRRRATKGAKCCAACWCTLTLLLIPVCLCMAICTLMTCMIR